MIIDAHLKYKLDHVSYMCKKKLIYVYICVRFSNTNKRCLATIYMIGGIVCIEKKEFSKVHERKEPWAEYAAKRKTKNF